MEWLVAQFDDVMVVGSAPASEYWPEASAAPSVRKITLGDLRAALRDGVADFAAARTDALFLGILYPLIGLFIALAEANHALLPLIFPTASGFALVGPFLAVGLYEISRRREQTGQINWLDAFQVVRSPAIGAIAGLGLILIVLFFLWLGAAHEIYNLTMGPNPPASLLSFLANLYTTPAGWTMIALGLSVGFLFAVAVLAISVVSFPLLLDRPASLKTAITTSLCALRQNPVPLLAWGLLVAVSLALATLPLFIGLIVVMPILGHSTWHLYRRIVRH
jgi:uncharacterized membrane protein